MNKLHKPRILFVDDEPHVLDALRRALRAHSGAWEMSFHTNGADALEAQANMPFEVAVVDMRMPGMSGLEVIRALASTSPGTVPIMLTGAADLETAIAAINEAKVFRFYTKPCPAAVLAGGIREALEHGQAASEPAPAPASIPHAVGLATLNRLPTGVVVVAADGHVLYMNSQGAAYVGKSDGLCVSPDGVCRASLQGESAELQRLVGEVADKGEAAPVRALALTREHEERPLSVVIAPLPKSSEAPQAVVLLISDPEHQTLPSAATIGRLFDLTDAEARLALAVGEGQRIEDAAESLGITLSSARTYLKRVFSKVGITRQAELVRLIMAAPSLLDLGGSARATGSHKTGSPVS